ncbi:disease resistance protein RGA2-like [Musa acuminata AAA Group]|uniref:disease resistance protein RGA2-like n=1 Tax=Musa acuminata AAA Group TaxID=214697 RepID=UPI0031D55F85
MAGVDLRHVLLDLLPSSDMTKRCRELGIQHHLQKIIPDLWAINAVIRDATMRAWAQPETMRTADVEMWMADAGAAIADVQNLLDRILEWPGRATATSNPLLRSFLSIRVAFRLSILHEFKEMGLRLKELVLRGSALDLRKEMMDAMDPCDEEYSYVLGDEVVGRDEDRDNIIEIIQQNQSSSNGEPFVIVIHDESSSPSYPSMGKTTLARMIYHHPWVRQHFHHRIWVDVFIDLSFDQLSIGRQFARCITGESCDHLQSHQAIWLLVNERLGQRRYLLILNDIYYSYWEEGLKDKWDQLKHNLLHVGGIGSTVIITTNHMQPIDIFGSRDYSLDGLSEDAWIKLFMRDTFIGSAQDKANTCTINFLLQFAEQQYQTLKGETISGKKLDGSPLLAKTLGSIFRYTEVLEDLQPNLALEKLEIVSYMGKKLPSWMVCKEGNLRHLREIKLVNLRKCERLPPLGQLSYLKTVEISGMDSISAVDDAFYGDGNGDTFPRLETLIFSEMPLLERWPKAKGEGDVFPVLRTLILIQCPKFKELHVRPSTTREFLILELWLNNDKLLTSEFVGWQNLKDVRVLEITGCEELRCLPQGIKYLKNLSDLYIIRCNNLISFPDWLAELPSLDPWEEHRIPFDLIVRDCAMLSFIPERLKPSPHFRMNIKGCPKLGV